MGLGYFKLNDAKMPIACEIEEYHQWIKKHPKEMDARRVADDMVNGSRVSTVFLGLDHSYHGNVPVLWETMVFGGKLDLEQERYTSHEDAVAGHKAMMNRVAELA